MNSNGLSDIILTASVMAVFTFGFIFGVFEIGRVSGITLLGMLGGTAIGIRVILMKEELLIPIFFLNWLVIGVFGVIGGLLIVFKQRVGIVSFSSQNSSAVAEI
jgi:hypothetical protein